MSIIRHTKAGGFARAPTVVWGRCSQDEEYWLLCFCPIQSTPKRCTVRWWETCPTHPAGGAVAGAQVRIVSTTTNESRETVSNSSGVYSFTNLEAGRYTVAIAMAGFQSYQTTHVVISIDSVIRLDATLQVGSVNEQVTVSAVAEGLQTDRSEVRHEITEDAL